LPAHFEFTLGNRDACVPASAKFEREHSVDGNVVVGARDCFCETGVQFRVGSQRSLSYEGASGVDLFAGSQQFAVMFKCIGNGLISGHTRLRVRIPRHG
jgi:hypothetical protein